MRRPINKVYETELGPSINTITGKEGEETQDMDMWVIRPIGGISTTPIIDPSTHIPSTNLIKTIKMFLSADIEICRRGSIEQGYRLKIE